MIFRSSSKRSSKNAFREGKVSGAFNTLSAVDGVLDTTQKGVLYGRVDGDYDSIYPREDRLVELSQRLLVLDFVKDAFVQLKNFLKQKKIRQQLKPPYIPIFDLEPKNQIVQFEEQWRQHVTTVYEDMITKVADKEIINFRTFLNQFGGYVQRENITLTKDQFIKTKAYENASGLVIELDTQNKNDKRAIFTTYMGHPSLKYFATAARKFGFVTDLNYPYILHANLTSSKMKRYVAKYIEDTSTKGIYKNYYQKAYLSDINELLVLIMQFYNSYVATRPQVRIPCENSLTQTRITARMMVTIDDFKDEKIISKIIDIYIELSRYRFSIFNGAGQNKNRLVSSLLNAISDTPKLSLANTEELARLLRSRR